MHLSKSVQLDTEESTLRRVWDKPWHPGHPEEQAAFWAESGKALLAGRGKHGSTGESAQGP